MVSQILSGQIPQPTTESRWCTWKRPTCQMSSQISWRLLPKLKGRFLGRFLGRSGKSGIDHPTSCNNFLFFVDRKRNLLTLPWYCRSVGVFHGCRIWSAGCSFCLANGMALSREGSEGWTDCLSPFVGSFVHQGCSNRLWEILLSQLNHLVCGVLGSKDAGLESATGGWEDQVLQGVKAWKRGDRWVLCTFPNVSWLYRFMIWEQHVA